MGVCGLIGSVSLRVLGMKKFESHCPYSIQLETGVALRLKEDTSGGKNAFFITVTKVCIVFEIPGPRNKRNDLQQMQKSRQEYCKDSLLCG